MKNNKILKSIIVIESVCVIGMSMLLCGCANENYKATEPTKEVQTNKKIDIILNSNKVETTVKKEPTKNNIKENIINKNTDDIPLEVIKEYYKYKEELINTYGEDTYNLMNIEAGIESEEQSLKHFNEYGI